MAPAVTSGAAGTGQELIAAGLPRRASLERVHHASYPGVPEAVRAARHHVAGVLAGVPTPSFLPTPLAPCIVHLSPSVAAVTVTSMSD